MKSTPEQLRQRGYLSHQDFNDRFYTDESVLESNLTSSDPCVRTAAARKIKQLHKYECIPLLCDVLKTEKCLYTKIELCDCLACLGDRSIDHLIPLIGKIGTNQHRTAGNYDLKKKSYPLPRDIVARILVRIGPSVFTALRTLLEETREEAVIAEVIDIVGHISYNCKDRSFEKELVDRYNTSTSELIQWKLIRSFQSFESEEVCSLLNEVINNEDTKIEIRKEAQRSLERMNDYKRRNRQRH